ncbi:MAG: branched-chain amino acid ABC transporter permease [Spirochaetaceae bacterium]
MAISRRTLIGITAAAVAVVIVLLVWRPTVLIYGIQRAGLYASIALPMALILGIVGIVNLAHGEFLMLGAYFVYLFSTNLGADPLMAMIPAMVLLFVLGILAYKATIQHVLSAPELNQVILTFGLAIIASETVNLIATTQPRKVSVGYSSASASIGELTFGIFDFTYVLAAIVIVVGLMLFLRRTRLGKAALAVGQNPKGAAIVGINVGRTYLLVFSLAVGILGIIATLFAVRYSLFPAVGAPFTMKSLAIIAMAGLGNLTAVVYCAAGLGLAEAFITSFRGYGGWAEIVFFALIVIVIMVRSFRGAKR